MILFSSPNPRLHTLHAKSGQCLTLGEMNTHKPSRKPKTPDPFPLLRVGSGGEIADHILLQWSLISPCNLLFAIIKPEIFTRKNIFLLLDWLLDAYSYCNIILMHGIYTGQPICSAIVTTSLSGDV